MNRQPKARDVRQRQGHRPAATGHPPQAGPGWEHVEEAAGRFPQPMALEIALAGGGLMNDGGEAWQAAPTQSRRPDPRARAGPPARRTGSGLLQQVRVIDERMLAGAALAVPV